MLYTSLSYGTVVVGLIPVLFNLCLSRIIGVNDCCDAVDRFNECIVDVSSILLQKGL